jgi:L-amino acid N-acyltransferase YncA
MEADIDAVLRIYVPMCGTVPAPSRGSRPTSRSSSRRAAVVERGLPFLVAEAPGAFWGSFTGAFPTRFGYRFTVEDSVYIQPDAVGLGIGGCC